jgi:hypothetical protein
MNKNTHEDQWNKIENPKISPHSYSHLIFWRKVPETYIGEKTSSTSGVGKTSTCQRLKLHHYLLPYKKINENGSKMLR